MNIARLFRALAMIAATLMTTCVLLAQTDRGSIEGTVKDPNGAVVPAAKVQSRTAHLMAPSLAARPKVAKVFHQRRHAGC